MGTVTIGRPPAVERATGRWNEPLNQWYTTAPVEVPAELWAKLQRFEAPLPRRLADAAAAEKLGVHVGGQTYQVLRPLYEEVAARIELNPQRATIWQFDGVVPGSEHTSPDGQSGKVSYRRMIAVLGENTLHVWTDRDWWRYRWCKVVAWALTKLGRLLPVQP